MQVANQGLLAIQFTRRTLQQLSQVQQVGEAALAISQQQQAGGQLKVVQQTMQHRQDALALPAATIITKLIDALLPEPLILIEQFQIRPAQTQGGAGQGRAQQTVIARLSTGS